jgi:hypothetical protein
MFGRVCQKLGRGEHSQRATLSCRDGLDEVRDCLGRQLGTIVQNDRLGKTLGRGHDATPQQNRDSMVRGIKTLLQTLPVAQHCAPSRKPSPISTRWRLFREDAS